MDGVIYHGNQILPGVKEFVDWLYRENKEFLFLTNNSGKTPRELQQKLARMGLKVDEHHFYTSALATANFIARQKPGAHAFVIGEPGLFNALYEKGITLDDTDPDYVVIGESSSYNYDNICRAVHYVQNGARLIGTNYDLTGPTEQGIMPACRAFVKPIELVTGKENNTPRAKGLQVSMLERGMKMDKGCAVTMYECLLCGACTAGSKQLFPLSRCCGSPIQEVF